MDTDQSMQLKSLCLKIYQYMYYPLSLIHMNRSRSQINWVKLSVNNSNYPEGLGPVKIPRSRPGYDFERFEDHQKVPKRVLQWYR